ncbi:unnamed protein product, partial [Trichogramma brassicae]
LAYTYIGNCVCHRNNQEKRKRQLAHLKRNGLRFEVPSAGGSSDLVSGVNAVSMCISNLFLFYFAACGAQRIRAFTGAKEKWSFICIMVSYVEGLCTSVRELDLRVSEQEAKSSAPVSPIKEDLENVKISTAKCSEFISRIPSIIAPYSATDQCEMLLSGVPSGLELSDNQVLKKTFSAMGMEHHERFITRTRSWKPKNSRSVKEHTRAIVLQCSSPIVRDGLMAQSHKLAKFENRTLFDTGGESRLSLSPLWPKNIYQLLLEAKSLSHRLHYASPIVRNLTVLMRKSPQSELIPIRKIKRHWFLCILSSVYLSKTCLTAESDINRTRIIEIKKGVILVIFNFWVLCRLVTFQTFINVMAICKAEMVTVLPIAKNTYKLFTKTGYLVLRMTVTQRLLYIAIYRLVPMLPLIIAGCCLTKPSSVEVIVLIFMCEVFLFEKNGALLCGRIFETGISQILSYSSIIWHSYYIYIQRLQCPKADLFSNHKNALRNLLSIHNTKQIKPKTDTLNSAKQREAADTEPIWWSWVRAIAAELVRQTPFRAQRCLNFLEILTTCPRTPTLESLTGQRRRSRSELRCWPTNDLNCDKVDEHRNSIVIEDARRRAHSALRSWSSSNSSDDDNNSGGGGVSNKKMLQVRAWGCSESSEGSDDSLPYGTGLCRSSVDCVDSAITLEATTKEQRMQRYKEARRRENEARTKRVLEEDARRRKAKQAELNNNDIQHRTSKWSRILEDLSPIRSKKDQSIMNVINLTKVNKPYELSTTRLTPVKPHEVRFEEHVPEDNRNNNSNYRLNLLNSQNRLWDKDETSSTEISPTATTLKKPGILRSNDTCERRSRARERRAVVRDKATLMSVFTANIQVETLEQRKERLLLGFQKPQPRRGKQS